MFSQHAPKYWAVGLPAMPLRPTSKIPALNAWQSFCASMPSEAVREAWLTSYEDGNIGLPLGPQAGVIALDLDSEDPRVAAILQQLMPPTPWVRRGKKGAVYAFKYTGERTYRIKDENNNTIMEVLSRGAQVVLPPSIHPDTGRPYEATSELYEVLDQLNPLPAQFEPMVRQALIDAGIKLQSRSATKVTDWVPAGGRDSALTSVAGIEARGVIRGERTMLEALNQMETWTAAYTEKVVGDTLDPAKGRSKVMEFVRRDIVDNAKALPSGWDAGMTDSERIEFRRYFGEDIEEWTQTQIIDHLTERFQSVPRENVAGRTAIIDEVLLRLARAQHLSSMDEDIVIQFIANANGRMISVGSMRKRIKELQNAGDLAGKDHSEIAKHLIKELTLFGEVRWQGSSFYQWAGAHWRELAEAEILKALTENYGHLDAARKHSDHKGIVRTVQVLVTGPLRRMDLPGINFANGYLTLDMELRPHDPAYGATYVLPYRYLPEGPSPLRFLGFLDQAFGHCPDYEQKVQAVRQVIAATLFGMGPRFSRAACFFGPPRSGKSTLLDIILGMVPDSARCSVPPHEWGDRFMPAQMQGRLVNQCGELSETQMINGAVFKSIVEGAEMSGQHKGRDIFKFRPLCMHLFASNHLPRTRDTSAGFNRRWLFLHFDRPITDDQKVIGLAQEIVAEEREAIAAWAIPAIEDLMRQQEYTLPASHVRLVAEVAATNNSVRFFLTSGSVAVVQAGPDVSSTSRTSERELYSLYYAFCKLSANASPVSLKRFRQLMEELQSELGFQCVTVPGREDEASYENIIVVKKAAGSK